MQFCCTFKRVQLFSIIVTSSVILTILVILFFFNYPALVKKRIIDAVIFKNGSEAMSRFITTEEIKNLRLSFYLFNVTNPTDVVDFGAKINLQEVGPFVYDELKVKDLTDNNQTSGLISYKLRKRYVFNRDLSVADADKLIITWPNVPLLVTTAFLEKLPFYTKGAAYMLLNQAIKTYKEPAFIKDSVTNFLFHGSHRELFENIQKLDVLKVINPWPLKDNMFALLYDKNNTWNPDTDWIMTVSAGFGGDQKTEDLNKYIYVNGSSTLPFWNPQPTDCNVVRGTDGEFFHPFQKHKQDLEVYSTDICRKLNFKFRQDINFKGVAVFKYSLDERSLQSGSRNAENQCYCLNSTQPSECSLDGLIDLSNCVTPNVIASGAHFILGSPSLLTRIQGLTQPDAAIHEPVIYVEPNTGLTIMERVPIQFNIRMSKNKLKIFDFFQDQESLILPLVWILETSELTEDQAFDLRNKLLLLDSWLVVMVLGGAIIFIVMIFVLAAIVCIRIRRPRRVLEPSETDPLISPEQRSISSN